MSEPAFRDWLLRSPTTMARLLRFGAVGGATSLGYALLVAGLVTWLPEPLAAGLAYLAMVPVNYLGHRRATFRSAAPTRPELLRFLAVHGVTLLASMAAMQLVTAGLGLSHWIGSLAIMVLAPVLNFVLLQLWVFGARADRAP